MRSSLPLRLALAAGLACGLPNAPAQAQENGSEENERLDARVGLGVKLRPDYPGSDNYGIGPLVSVSTRRGDEPFAFGTPDQSFGVTLVSEGGLAAGPVLNLQGSRKESDVGAPVGEISTTVEAGGFVQYQMSPSFRLRSEVRKGIGGHRGVIADLGADYVARDADKYLFSIGPRLKFSDGRYQRAYFGVSEEAAAASGLAEHRPGGGLYAAGATATTHLALGSRLGIYGFGRYERLLNDAADSPIVKEFGSPNQFSTGLGLTYVFTIRD